jgi:ElaB/YqjD/DUF883 family membrane-anchored ribosome-binding protein
MNKFMSGLKNIRPLRILTAFVAAIFLLITQACNSADATTPVSSTPHQIEGPQSAEPNSQVYVPKGAKVISPYEGGMNNFSDTDPRSATAKTEVKVKAEALKENAEQNLIDQTSNVGENTRRILDKKGDNVEDLGKNLQRQAEYTKSNAEEAADDFAKGTKRGIENIQENTKNAAQGAGQNVQSAAEDAKLNAKRTADKAGEAVNRSATETGENVKYNAKQTSENLTEKGKSAIENAKEFFQGKTDEAAQSTQSNLDKANNAVLDSVD